MLHFRRQTDQGLLQDGVHGGGQHPPELPGKIPRTFRNLRRVRDPRERCQNPGIRIYRSTRKTSFVLLASTKKLELKTCPGGPQRLRP